MIKLNFFEANCDEMTKWCYGHLMKWLANKMNSGWNNQLAKHVIRKMTSCYTNYYTKWCYIHLMKWLANKMTSGWNNQLAKHAFHKMASWQNVKAPTFQDWTKTFDLSAFSAKGEWRKERKQKQKEKNSEK